MRAGSEQRPDMGAAMAAGLADEAFCPYRFSEFALVSVDESVAKLE
jgi:hypothetical protein